LLLSIRKPDILHLRGFAQKLFAFALHGIEPVAGITVIDPCALHIPHRRQFNLSGAFRRAKVLRSVPRSNSALASSFAQERGAEVLRSVPRSNSALASSFAQERGAEVPHGINIIM